MSEQPATDQPANDPFNIYDPSRKVEMLPGVSRQMLAAGNGAMVVRIDLAKGSEVPMHTHVHEQIGHLASGRATLKIGDKAVELKPGDCYAIPSNVHHGMYDCYVDSIFMYDVTPQREDVKH